jgi:hypothetical protein
MTHKDRERRHQASVARINRVQLVVGRGDAMRIDHEGTLLERARLLDEEMRSHHSTELGLAALDRLLQRAEERSARHTREIVAFVTAMRDQRPLALHTLRGLDPGVGDDMLAVLDAFRYARLDLVESVDGGPRRVARVLEQRRIPSA